MGLVPAKEVRVKTIPLPPLWGCAVLLATVPTLAGAPMVSFLTPARHTAAPAERVQLRVATGLATDAQPGPWPGSDVAWLFVRDGPTQENRHEVHPDTADGDAIAVELTHPGVALIGVERRPAVLAMTGAELQSFSERNAGPVAAEKTRALTADRALRVRHLASAKTLIRVQAGGESLTSAIATSKTGQSADIRPHFDPTAAQVGSDLPLTIYVEGDKQAGVKVQATNATTGKTESFTTDGGGSGHFRISDAGVWRVEFHRVSPLRDEPEADWAIYSATLTFEVTAKGAGP